MTTIQTKYYPAKYGLGTEYSVSEMPLEYMYKFTNRFINIRGDAEKRQGIIALGSAISGTPVITGLHEYVSPTGVTTLFASGAGVIYKYNDSAETWSTALTGKDSAKRLISCQMAGKLIFVNGSDRNFYTDDAGSNFQDLVAMEETGTVGTSSATSLTDTRVTNWLSSTFINNNDLLYNRTLNAYAFITSVGAANLTHTPIASSGAAARGQASRNQASGDVYEIHDMVELNIIPVGPVKDNYTALTSGSSATQIRVSGVNFSTTEIKVGDYISNTTRNAIMKVNAVSANLAVTSCAAQTVGDSIQLFKSAMPIATWPHVHYGRLYLIDARDQGLKRIGGPADPQDFTTYQKTLASNSIAYTSQQPQAETILSLKSFQQYLVAGGSRNVYIHSGTEPIADTTAAAIDFLPVGLFPQGMVSRFAMESIGGSMIFGANDGIRNFNAVFAAETFQSANISEAIKSEITAALTSKEDDPDEIQAIHYPRRNWLMFKIGDTIYNYNYTPTYSTGKIETSPLGSFSTFTGRFAQQKTYFIRKNGDLICSGDGTGLVYEYDQGDYSDNGDTIPTVLETSFLTLTEPQQSTQSRSGTYIKPIFETSPPITYTIEATGGFNELGTDTATVTTTGVGMVGFGVVGSSPVGGRRVLEEKVPLRWKGEQFKIRITTDSTKGPDIITGFVIYGNVLGKQ